MSLASCGGWGVLKKNWCCTGVLHEKCFAFSMAWIWNELVELCSRLNVPP
jgi:hypothetical protein